MCLRNVSEFNWGRIINVECHALGDGRAMVQNLHSGPWFVSPMGTNDSLCCFGKWISLFDISGHCINDAVSSQRFNGHNYIMQIHLYIITTTAGKQIAIPAMCIHDQGVCFYRKQTDCGAEWKVKGFNWTLILQWLILDGYCMWTVERHLMFFSSLESILQTAHSRANTAVV